MLSEFDVNINRPFLKDTFRLSNGELDVAAKMVEGKRSKQIGDELCITEKTVKFHLTNIYKKLEVDGRLRAIMKLQQCI